MLVGGLGQRVVVHMQKHKLNVMQIIRNLDVGGAQEVVRTLVDYLVSGDCVPVVCTFRDGPLRRDIEQLGVKVEVLPPRRHSIVAFPLFAVDMVRIWWTLVRLVKEYDIDVIQTHLLRSLDFLVLLLRYTTRLRVVLWTFHSADFVLSETELPKHKWLLKPKRYVHHLLYRLTSYLVSGFIAVSDEVKEAMVEVIGPIGDRITVICNGVDVRRYGQPVDEASVHNQLGLDAAAHLISVVATLKEQKGHRYLVEAMGTIVPRYPDAHALFVGHGALREELQNLVRRLNLDGHVHFLGNRHDVPALLAASDLFVLPSLCEGLSMALLEAMASGRPIVATSVSGTNQVMIHSETGLLVAPRDSHALADAITQLLSDPARAQAMGQAAKRHVEAHYSAQKQADEHIALYCRFLAQSAVF
jgi:glycosyltransferase involved in cell wall biosynthesis